MKDGDNKERDNKT